MCSCFWEVQASHKQLGIHGIYPLCMHWEASDPGQFSVISWHVQLHFSKIVSCQSQQVCQQRMNFISTYHQQGTSQQEDRSVRQASWPPSPMFSPRLCWVRFLSGSRVHMMCPEGWQAVRREVIKYATSWRCTSRSSTSFFSSVRKSAFNVDPLKFREESQSTAFYELCHADLGTV